jgi:serine phosphatase RsbU (regulator of sigma subunit)
VDTSVAQLLRELDTQPPFALLDTTREHLGNRVGAEDVILWLVDYEQKTLVRWTPPGEPLDGGAPVDEGELGAAFVTQRSTTEQGDDSCIVRTPVTIRAERLGVLEIRLPGEPDAFVMQMLQGTGTILAYVLLGARRYTDVFERVRRRRALEVPAELQWELLPVLAHEGPDFTLAGALEPAYDIGGDNFDYAVEPQGLVVTITDAMGHGTKAALLCSLAVAVQRNARRRGMSLRQQVRAANVAVHDYHEGEAFLTQLALRINRSDGTATAVNAGHSYAFLLRGDVVEPLRLSTDLPIGMFSDSEYRPQELSFAPGDRLLLITDGIAEAMPDDGEEFGVDRVVELLRTTADDHPTEVVRKLTNVVMEHRAGALLDDATALCIDYRRRR